MRVAELLVISIIIFQISIFRSHNIARFIASSLYFLSEEKYMFIFREYDGRSPILIFIHLQSVYIN